MEGEHACQEGHGRRKQTPARTGRAEASGPEDPALRKLYVGHINADTDRAAMQSYFEKFGAVEQCYRTTEKETNENKEYGFVVFRAAATAEEVQRARPHTLMGRVVSTKRAVPREWKGNPEAEMKSK